MNLIEVIVALAILGFFMFGFSQIFLPAFNEWSRAASDYYAAHTIQFIADSFRKECAKPYPDMKNWRKSVSVAKELESCEITELIKNDKTYALKAVCSIAGEYIEILGLCKP
jgi:prepilin-type N-terminal cleavage/methylation domain-containing protein